MRTIVQSARFVGVSVEDIYATYMDSEKHAAAIGAPARVEPRVGGRVVAFGEDAVQGKFLHIDANRLIVQTWRSRSRWLEDEDDSILALSFEPRPSGSAIQLVQFGVPDREYALFNSGWRQRYWRPWRAYFAQLRKSRRFEKS